MSDALGRWEPGFHHVYTIKVRCMSCQSALLTDKSSRKINNNYVSCSFTGKSRWILGPVHMYLYHAFKNTCKLLNTRRYTLTPCHRNTANQTKYYKVLHQTFSDCAGHCISIAWHKTVMQHFFVVYHGILH